ncbi:MAG: MATE family efflux transporter [Clostridium butyricum]|nr:MATE family efflux transporter [Clostridium butyricum]
MSNINKINSNTSLFKLTWPIFIELVLQMLVSNADQLMISRVSQNAVAAIGNVNQIMNVLLITFNIITMATIILVSQYLGAENKNKVSEVYSVALFTNLAFSMIISILLLMFNKQIFTMMKLPGELFADAGIYISIVGGGIFLQAIFLTYSAIFRSNGLMKQGMYISVLINIINIVGNFILINGYLGFPKLGISGVAISSVFSRLVGVVIIIYSFKVNIKEKISIKYLKPFPFETFKRLMKIGLPTGGESISYSLSQMVILIFVNTMGTTAITTKAYVNILVWFSFLYSSAVGQANQIRVGYLIGAGDEDGAYKKVISTLKPALLVSIVMSMILYLFSDIFLSVFTSNTEIFKVGKTLFFIDIFLEVGRTINIVIIRGLQAAGDIKYPTCIGIIFMWFIATGLSYVFGIEFGLGLAGVWLAMMLDECFRAVIFYRRWNRGAWKSRNII